MINLDPREDAAVDALITASLHIADSEVTEEEAREFMKNPPKLSPEQEARLADWEPDLFGDEEDANCAPKPYSAARESTELYAAMNRKNSEDSHSGETEEELKLRRKQALERLRKKRPQDE